MREAFPDFRAEIGWQTVESDLVTTYKVYYGTHLGPLLGVAPTGRAIHFETVDAFRVPTASSPITGVSPTCSGW